MEEQTEIGVVEINAEAKRLNELLQSKRCARHEIKKGKKAKRAKQKQQLRKEMRDESPSFCIPTPAV